MRVVCGVLLLALAVCALAHEEVEIDGEVYLKATPLVSVPDAALIQLREGRSLSFAKNQVTCGHQACPLAKGVCCPGVKSCCPTKCVKLTEVDVVCRPFFKAVRAQPAVKTSGGQTLPIGAKVVLYPPNAEDVVPEVEPIPTYIGLNGKQVTGPPPPSTNKGVLAPSLIEKDAPLSHVKHPEKFHQQLLKKMGSDVDYTHQTKVGIAVEKRLEDKLEKLPQVTGGKVGAKDVGDDVGYTSKDPGDDVGDDNGYKTGHDVRKRVEKHLKQLSHKLDTDGIQQAEQLEKHLEATLPMRTNQIASLTVSVRREPPVVDFLKSLTTTRCKKTLGGFLLHDLQSGQPRLNMKKVYATINKFQNMDSVNVVQMGTNDGLPVYVVDFPSLDPIGSASKTKKPRVLISSGVHGNEPVAVVANLQVMAELVHSPLRQEYHITFIPVMNPGGLTDNLRSMRNGHDLNREFTTAAWPTSLMPLEAYLKKHHFSLSMDLHGAKSRTGFFIIKAKSDNRLAHSVLTKLPLKELLQTDSGQYPGWVSLGALLHKYHLKEPGTAKSGNPGTMKGFMSSRGTPKSYTVEYPGYIPLCDRQRGLVSIATGMLKNLRRHR